ncbi:DUF5709 domain-containing protein [Dactylosporangium sp. NPDC051484]|uniref:DUF5709 domain-containing protein n=1 Tax=Dactylosporangium sp. NPDC051484 TaxID=3154942 RepID=UPI00344B47D5
MRRDCYPRPVSDPEALGLPGTADPDSTAWDDVDSPRIADGPDPGSLPLDRDDPPVAVDHYGTTAWEARAGEPLELKLGREMPEDEGFAGPAPDEEDEDALALPPHSHASVYDLGGGLRDELVGRLVGPDEGGLRDDEPDAVARDAGAAGGGPSAEELAMHPIREPPD